MIRVFIVTTASSGRRRDNQSSRQLLEKDLEFMSNAIELHNFAEFGTNGGFCLWKDARNGYPGSFFSKRNYPKRNWI